MKKRSYCTETPRGERIRLSERNSPADSQTGEEGGEGGASGAGAEILLQFAVKILTRHEQCIILPLLIFVFIELF